MKKLIILSALVISSLVYSSAKAQVRFNVNINIGNQPVWVNNNNAADYYYIPDIDCYYSVPERVYVYHEGNYWRKSAYLPSRYRNYDFRNKRVISIKGQDKPYLHHEENRRSYAQAVPRYQHPSPSERNDKYYNKKGRDNSRGYNNGRGHDDRRPGK